MSSPISALGEPSVVVSFGMCFPQLQVSVFPQCVSMFKPSPMILFSPHSLPASSHCCVCVVPCPRACCPSSVPGPSSPAVFPQALVPQFPQLSVFSCCSPSSKRPSFDSQYLQLVAAPPPRLLVRVALVSVCPSAPSPHFLRSEYLPVPFSAFFTACSCTVSCLRVFPPTPHVPLVSSW